jgi:hypothetical protein
VRKAARTIDVEDRMAVLHDIRDSLRSLASSGPLTKAHADVLGAIGVQVSLLRDAFTREQERIRKRVGAIAAAQSFEFGADESISNLLRRMRH